MCNNYHFSKQPNPNKCSTSAIILSCFKSGWQYMYEIKILSIRFSSLSSLKTKKERLYKFFDPFKSMEDTCAEQLQVQRKLSVK